MIKIKDKEKILKATRGKQKEKKRKKSNKGKAARTYKGTTIRRIAHFSVETTQARKEWYGIFKVMKDKNVQPRILQLARLSFRIDGDLKSFMDKWN